MHFVPVPFPVLGQALKRHAIDVAWLPEPTASADAQSMGLAGTRRSRPGRDGRLPGRLVRRDEGVGEEVPADAGGVPRRAQAGQQIADSSRTAVERAMEKLPAPFTVSPTIAAVMSIETYPLNIAPDINLLRVQRVANEMLQFHMLKTKFQVSSMLGGPVAALSRPGRSRGDVLGGEVRPRGGQEHHDVDRLDPEPALDIPPEDGLPEEVDPGQPVPGRQVGLDRRWRR